VRQESIVEFLIELSEQSVAGAEREINRGKVDGEDWLKVTLFIGLRAASVSFWSRPQMGGLLDFEVVDGENDAQVYWTHLEGANSEQIGAAWREMVLALLG
jgi:hypothetical protein